MKRPITRREFLRTSLTLTGCACCAAALGPFRPMLSYAQSSGGTGRSLVLFNLFGGTDPLNTFAVPYTVPAYYDRRPTIAVPENAVLQLAQGIGLNPALTNLHQLYQDGDVAIIQGIGDPVGTRSHFTSQEIFSRGATDQGSAYDNRGWVGRFGDLYFSNSEFNTLGIGVGQQTDFVSNRQKNRPLITSRLSNFGFRDDSTGNRDNVLRRRIQENLIKNAAEETARDKAILSSQKAVYDGAATIAQVSAAYSNLVTYPATGPGNYFIDVARIVEYGLGTKVFYGGTGGWDTHSNQVAALAGRLTQVDEAIGAFATDLRQMGKWNNTSICIFTEFGRNTFENSSGGTDHGWGGTMIVIGGGVKGGVYGATPSDHEIRNNRWIYMDIDFRNVFSELINWLGYNPGPVFPEQYVKTNVGVLL